MGWVNKNSGTKKFYGANKKKQLGGSLRPPVAPLGGGLNPNVPSPLGSVPTPPDVGIPNPYLEEGGELKKYKKGDTVKKSEAMEILDYIKSKGKAAAVEKYGKSTIGRFIAKAKLKSSLPASVAPLSVIGSLKAFEEGGKLKKYKEGDSVKHPMTKEERKTARMQTTEPTLREQFALGLIDKKTFDKLTKQEFGPEKQEGVPSPKGPSKK